MKIDPETLARLEAEGRVTDVTGPGRTAWSTHPSTIRNSRIVDTSVGDNLAPTASTRCIKLTPRDPFARMKSKLEIAYSNHLEIQRKLGAIDRWEYEWVTFRLSESTRYTPDFAIFKGDSLAFREVKGFWSEDGLLRFRVARDSLPFELKAVRRIKGEWIETDTPHREERRGERAARKENTP